MKNLFIIWITFQLMLMGYWDMQERNVLYRGEFDCNKVTMDGEVREWIGAALPLLTIPTKVTLIEMEVCKK